MSELTESKGLTQTQNEKIPATNLSKSRVEGNFRLFLYLKLYKFLMLKIVDVFGRCYGFNIANTSIKPLN
jgi:hypothetical protein